MWNTTSKNPINPTFPQPVILLFGPTGVGKTELLLRQFSAGYEVVSADALQVYRRLDIGTAKPTSEEQKRIPHHLIDIKEPYEQFNVGEFVRLADKKVQDILSRGLIPVISGGTAYYFKHFLYGLPAAPPSDPQARREIQREADCKGTAALYRRLEEVDPVSARTIAPQDSYRIQRALEVYETSGRPLSHYKVPQTLRSHLDPVIIGLYRDQQELNSRIEERVNRMMEQGLYDEVKSLVRTGAQPHWPAMKGIGYREFFLYRATGEYCLDSLTRLIAGNTKQYAKQQLTFFRSLPLVQWVRPEEEEHIRKLAAR